MRRYSPKFIFLTIALLMFFVGTAIDYYLRANVGKTCFGCSTFVCKIVFIADNPLIVHRHPVDIINDLF